MNLRPKFMVGIIVVIYLLGQISQIAVTPMGATMDFYGHLAYISFFSDEGHAPTPQEVSVPAWIIDLEKNLPAPDPSFAGERYHTWANLSAIERQQRMAAILDAPRQANYLAPNYQSQHPPLYYWLLSRFYHYLNPVLTPDRLVYVLGFLSVCLAALGIPAIYLTLRLYMDETAATAGLTALAWFPNLLVFLGRITNDTLAFPFVAWALYFCCAGRNTRSISKFIFAGVLLTLASFTKTYALTLFPVYVLCGLLGKPRFDWRLMGLTSVLSFVGVGALLGFNYTTTGHFILLHQIRLTDALPLSAQIQAIGKLDPKWFMGGMVKGFWWSGDWSFVSPGIFYYLPLLLLIVFLKPPDKADKNARFFSIEQLWPHYLALVSFFVGMMWHATTFILYASQIGETVHSGNEGWYANVLIGSVFTIGIVILKQRFRSALFQKIMVSSVIFSVLWNGIARVTLFVYWSGLAEMEGPVRGIRWGEVYSRLISGSVNPGSWMSLPGIIQPIWLTFILPLVVAMMLTGIAVVNIRRYSTKPSV